MTFGLSWHGTFTLDSAAPLDVNCISFNCVYLGVKAEPQVDSFESNCPNPNFILLLVGAIAAGWCVRSATLAVVVVSAAVGVAVVVTAVFYKQGRKNIGIEIANVKGKGTHGWSSDKSSDSGRRNRSRASSSGYPIGIVCCQLASHTSRGDELLKLLTSELVPELLYE